MTERELILEALAAGEAAALEPLANFFDPLVAEHWALYSRRITDATNEVLGDKSGLEGHVSRPLPDVPAGRFEIRVVRGHGSKQVGSKAFSLDELNIVETADAPGAETTETTPAPQPETTAPQVETTPTVN